MKKLLLTLATAALLFTGCNSTDLTTTENGISPKTAQEKLVVKKQANGMTLEQANIVKSYEVENRPGAVKHLYVISPYNGSVLIYSTVAGKVTSNTKGLKPSETAGRVSNGSSTMPFYVNGVEKRTKQVMNESGTYGTSKPEYIFWWDTKGVYHKHFVTGGQMIHISDQPMPVRDVVLNMNLAGTPNETK